MKKILDPTVSKRPMNVPENDDIELLVLNRTKLDLEIQKLELQIDKLKEADPKSVLTDELVARKNYLAHNAMTLAPDDYVKHATVAGQYFEVVNVLEMQKKIQENLDNKISIRERIGRLIGSWSEKIIQRSQDAKRNT